MINLKKGMVTKSPALCVDRNERVGSEEEKSFSPTRKHSVPEIVFLFSPM